jgi:hypothetical protein
MFILDGLAELGPENLLSAGQDLAGQLARLNPGARLSWRQIGLGPASNPRATGSSAELRFGGERT